MIGSILNKGLTQKDLSARMDVSQSTICRILRGALPTYRTHMELVSLYESVESNSIGEKARLCIDGDETVVNVVGKTPKKYRIAPLNDPINLPRGRVVHPSETALVPRRFISFS